MKFIDRVSDAIGSVKVFGEPFEKDGVTVIPAFSVSGGGGGGGPAATDDGAGGAGIGVNARPAGAFVIKDGNVTWMPAFDLNRTVIFGIVFGIIAVMSWRSVAKAAIRARR